MLQAEVLKEYTIDMKTVIQIISFLCLVIEGLAMYHCRNDGSGTLSSCLNNPNIRIEKTREGHGNNIKTYQLSLHYQNTLWVSHKWIECNHLCEVCESLLGISNEGENIWLASILVRSKADIVML